MRTDAVAAEGHQGRAQTGIGIGEGLKDKSPAFQWYPKQYLGDDDVLQMEWDARGMHHWLLNLSWQQEPVGSIPDDMGILRRWLGLPSGFADADRVWARVWPQIKQAWYIREGRWFNAGMVRAWDRQQTYKQNGSKTRANPKQIAEDEDRSSKKERVLVFSNGDSVDFAPDVWVMKIKDAHPRLLRPLDTERVIVDALDMLQNRMGSVRNAAQYLLAKTELYKTKTDKWPKVERQFILGSFEWFKSHCYEEPEANWDRGEAIKPPVTVDNRGADEELKRQLGGKSEKK